MPKKKFRVTYKSINYYYIDVEANNYLDAQIKSQGKDREDFIQEQGLEVNGSWVYNGVEEIKD